jgi:hypothetical protein
MAEREIVYPSILRSYGKELDEVPPVVSIPRQIDDVLNTVFGLAPAEPLFNIVRDIGPANVIRTLTGIPKPSEVINEAIDEIAASIREKVRARLPTPYR